jgi:hypothetical protein
MSNKRTIVMNNRPVKITSSLGLALRYLRSETTPRILWIDALCINQIENEEKTYQVQRMKEIYDQAHEVIAWLGEPDEHGEEAITLLETVGQTVIESNMLLDPMYLFKRSHLKPERLTEIGLNLTDTQWRRLWELLMRDYFEMIWIVQELRACGFMLFDCHGALRLTPSLQLLTKGLFMCGRKSTPKHNFDVVFVLFGLICKSPFGMDLPSFFSGPYMANQQPLQY